MKKTIIYIFLALQCYTINNLFAISLGTNITIFDEVNTNNSGWYGKQEDQEIEPNCIKGQVWDLEGFYLNNNILTIVGGYDFKNGYQDTSSGDIFIDLTGDASYGPSNDNTGYNNKVVSNSFGYDYVLDLNFENFTYNVYALSELSKVKTVFFKQNQESNAWKYENNGVLLFENLSFDYFSGLSDSDVGGLLGGTHNAASFDLSFFDYNKEFVVHNTMECGNDNLMGKHNTETPEPLSIVFLGLGILSIFFLNKKSINFSSIA